MNKFEFVRGLPDAYGYFLFLFESGKILTGYYDHRSGEYSPLIYTLAGEDLSYYEHQESEIVGYFKISNG